MTTPKPLAESYWVIPGRLLAGKYPGGKNLKELERRLGVLLDAGFDGFLDLTESGELPAYDGYLPPDVLRHLFDTADRVGALLHRLGRSLQPKA